MLISANHKDFDTYYADLASYAAQGVTHEQATRFAFGKLLDSVAKQEKWTMILEQKLEGSLKRPDATLKDEYLVPRGYWEAKDTQDDLEAEIQKKIQRKYPLKNTIFEDTQRAILYQNGRVVLDVNLNQRPELAELLTRFFSHTDEQIEEFHKAVAQFKEDIPNLAAGLKKRIEDGLRDNPAFAAAFDTFHTLCKNALNPAIRADAIEEMLVQHLLTERLFGTVLGTSDFTKRNVIAAEIEKVISALISQSFSRQEFLNRLDYFYVAIETEAKTITTYSEKQEFLNTVYERFFQGFSKDQADTHGIVYTPQEIVDFMCESVEHVLQTEFGLSLSDKGVVILDPCTGTGNFLVNIVRRLSMKTLEHKFRHELFANEVMLLPYYIASLNIEHAFYEKMGHYEAFEGICFTDTLDLTEAAQPSFAIFNEENTERVQREKDAAVTVIIGNPPYYKGQNNENDNRKQRSYPVIDGRIKETYSKSSKAKLKSKNYNAYIRFIRWAVDRLKGQDGIICFITNNSFIYNNSLDGVRNHLSKDFTHIYHLDLGGDIRDKRHGGENVFGDRCADAVGITMLIRSRAKREFLQSPASVYYSVIGLQQSTSNKNEEVATLRNIANVAWEPLQPDHNHSWLTEGLNHTFTPLIPIGVKDKHWSLAPEAVFHTQSLGASTNRDAYVYDYDKSRLEIRIEKTISDYNAEVLRWSKAGKPKGIELDNFVKYDSVKWSEHLKKLLLRERYGEFNPISVSPALYRPFSQRWMYYDTLLVDRPGTFETLFPTPQSQSENSVICLTDSGSEKPFMVMMSNIITDLHFVGTGVGTQCFPLYTYALDGKIRRENITDWALSQFQEKYGPEVTKRDIFHYVYALLHHPEYRERYKENLKRELPRIPLVEPEGNQKGTRREPEGNQKGTRREPEGNQKGTRREPEGNQKVQYFSSLFPSAQNSLRSTSATNRLPNMTCAGWKTKTSRSPGALPK